MTIQLKRSWIQLSMVVLIGKLAFVSIVLTGLPAYAKVILTMLVGLIVVVQCCRSWNAPKLTLQKDDSWTMDTQHHIRYLTLAGYYSTVPLIVLRFTLHNAGLHQRLWFAISGLAFVRITSDSASADARRQLRVQLKFQR